MRHQRGFTLTELVLVMVLTGILAVAIAPRLNLGDFEVAAAKGELVDAIRYVQGLAMNHTGGNGYRIQVTAAGYRLQECTASGCSATAEISNPYTGAAEYIQSWSNVTVTPTGTIRFDGRGQPTFTGGLIPAGNTRNITLTTRGVSATVAVESFTGFAR